MKKYERIIALLVLIQFIPFSVYAQLGSSSTMKKIDTIENNTATDITLRPGENVVIDSTSHIQVPIGTTAERDPAPVNGVLRYNSDNNEFEGFINGLWDAIGGGIDLTTKGNLVGYDGVETKECVLTATNDYILTYDSTADCGFDFKAAPVSTTLTAKGQLQTHDGTSNASFDVGADGRVLTADSTQPLGLSWQVPDYYVSPTTTKGDLLVNGGGGNGSDVSFSAGADGDVIFYDSATSTGLNTKPYSPLTAKADIYTYNGTSEVSFSAGADGDVIYYDSLTATGLNTKPYSPLTTKGDLYIFDTDNNRLPVGAQGAFLMVDDTKPEGIQWYDGVTVKDYDDTPVGTVIAYGSTNVPSGYLLADGACYKKLDYEQLFNVIGTSAGECTVTTTNDGFNVPNLKDQFLRGKSDARSVFDSQADATAVNGLSTGTQSASHQHIAPYNINTTVVPNRFGATTAGGTLNTRYNHDGAGINTNLQALTSAEQSNHTHSLSGDSETRPANIAVVYMIKAEGREPIFGIEKKGLAPNKAGFIIWSAFSATPEGHRLANGDCVLKTDYDDLFTNIGTQFGECTVITTNDGFNLPDLVTENRFIRAAGGSIAHGTIQQDADQRIQGTLSNSTSGEANAIFSAASGAFTLATPTNDGTGNLAGNTKYKDALFDSANVVDTANESRPNNIALTPFIKMYNNDVITGVFEQIEEVIVELDENNTNELTAVFSSVGTLARSNHNWISSTSQLNTGEYRIIYSGLGLTEIPNIVVSPNTPCVDAFTVSVTTTQADITTRNNVGTNTNCSFNVQVSKQGVDVNKLTQNRVIKDSSLEHYNLGDCKYSILDTTQFSTLHTGKWVRLEGQSISGTDVANEFGITTLPDAVSNGAFIRQVGGNSAAIRVYQEDQLLEHQHFFYSTANLTPDNAPNRAQAGLNTADTFHLTSNVQNADAGSENRPKNIALNFYCLVSY